MRHRTWWRENGNWMELRMYRPCRTGTATVEASRHGEGGGLEQGLGTTVTYQFCLSQSQQQREVAESLSGLPYLSHYSLMWLWRWIIQSITPVQTCLHCFSASLRVCFLRAKRRQSDLLQKVVGLHKRSLHLVYVFIRINSSQFFGHSKL